MVPNITIERLRNITFPVFKIPDTEWLTFENNVLKWKHYVVDDKNLPGDTLGRRRLHCTEKLFRMRSKTDSIVEILQSTHLVFIDSKGYLFKYKKTMWTTIKCHKIDRIELKETASLLWVHGVKTPFVISRPPRASYTWVTILYYKQNPWLLYEYCLEKQATARKMI